jgi:hypothetical protein
MSSWNVDGSREERLTSQTLQMPLPATLQASSSKTSPATQGQSCTARTTCTCHLTRPCLYAPAINTAQTAPIARIRIPPVSSFASFAQKRIPCFFRRCSCLGPMETPALRA